MCVPRLHCHSEKCLLSSPPEFKMSPMAPLCVTIGHRLLLISHQFFNFSFLDEPTFTSPTVPTMHLNTNDSTTLTCHVNSNPPSNITWLKDNSLLFNNSKTFIIKSLQYIDKFRSIVISTLRLNYVDKVSSGNYSCKATNDVATKYQQTRVMVKCKFLFIFSLTL